MSYRLRAGVSSDVGSYRDVNQDAAFTAPWAVGVADGVGGGPAGDLASAALVHRLVAGGPRCADAEELAGRIRGANWDLGAHVRRDPALAGMATTYTGLWLAQSGALLLAHTGDSRAYLLRDGALSRQTRDDSFVQALIDQGLVRAEDAWSHPRRNIITASLSGDERDVIRVETRDAVVGDRWLLCSDGITDYVPEPDVAEILAITPDPGEAAALVVALALDAASRDNVTAVVCDIVDGVPDLAAVPRLVGAAAARFGEVVEEGLATA
ncbi:PP2C family serine/threonine-protein phosphatase [uncultured Microbacterium sp.]|uniref:Protein phosphatase 2C domain protein n=1 Tax=uncultured Microbacterium sp. TaxID=191216 RepID=A0A1Y5P5R3_9MICO|nr:protein phosphatase 2C domain-containing protein [uncultured Microbacterium sp.]SBS74013.1 Protein phosphatase 2C domain protein [uncultured Microbacterium sp.]